MAEKDLTFEQHEETVTITVKEYDELIKDQNWLQCLEAAGVDNWDGYDFAREIEEEQDNG